MESKLKDQTVRERIRDVEKAQSIAELKQVISNLEFQVSKQLCQTEMSSNETWFNLNSYYLEPTTYKEFRRKGPTYEFGGHNVQS